MSHQSWHNLCLLTDWCLDHKRTRSFLDIFKFNFKKYFFAVIIAVNALKEQCYYYLDTFSGPINCNCNSCKWNEIRQLLTARKRNLGRGNVASHASLVKWQGRESASREEGSASGGRGLHLGGGRRVWIQGEGLHLRGICIRGGDRLLDRLTLPPTAPPPPPPHRQRHRILRDAVNKRVVRILLECFLVLGFFILFIVDTTS